MHETISPMLRITSDEVKYVESLNEMRYAIFLTKYVEINMFFHPPK